LPCGALASPMFRPIGFIARKSNGVPDTDASPFGIWFWSVGWNVFESIASSGRRRSPNLRLPG
jgi:hypothetical protein